MSKVRRLPEELRDMINGMLDAGHTVREVADALAEAGAEISRSSVGRYRLEWQEAMAELREIREFSEIAVRSLAESPESLTGKYNIALIEGALARAMMSLRATMQKDPEKAVKLLVKAAMAQSMLTRAAKDDAEKTIKATDFADERAEPDENEGPAGLAVEFVNAPEPQSGPGQGNDDGTANDAQECPQIAS